MPSPALLQLTSQGLYCPQGDFFIDPWGAARRAVVTHLHGDHAHVGCDQYLVVHDALALARLRLGADAQINGIGYGETLNVNGVAVTLFPAGHIHGSAQVHLESEGQIWVVSGDYKLHSDPTCHALEVVRCHTFVSESTFGLPIYRWPDPKDVIQQIHQWWQVNQEAGKASVLYGYSLGKAQRLLASLNPDAGPIYVHGAVLRVNQAYAADGVELPVAPHANASVPSKQWRRALILAPPWAHATPWLRRFAPYSTAMASGWMRIRGTRRRRTLDRGFVFSDHADWPGLLQVIAATGAEQIWTTHGYSAALARKLIEDGLAAAVIETRFRGETLEESGAEDPEFAVDDEAGGL